MNPEGRKIFKAAYERPAATICEPPAPDPDGWRSPILPRKRCLPKTRPADWLMQVL
jgi:hypothetical protein